MDLVCRQGQVDHSDPDALSNLEGLACPVDLVVRLVQARPVTIYSVQTVCMPYTAYRSARCALVALVSVLAGRALFALTCISSRFRWRRFAGFSLLARRTRCPRNASITGLAWSTSRSGRASLLSIALALWRCLSPTAATGTSCQLLYTSVHAIGQFLHCAHMEYTYECPRTLNSSMSVCSSLLMVFNLVHNIGTYTTHASMAHTLAALATYATSCVVFMPMVSVVKVVSAIWLRLLLDCFMHCYCVTPVIVSVILKCSRCFVKFATCARVLRAQTSCLSTAHP